LAFVKAFKSVDFPALGNPIIPISAIVLSSNFNFSFIPGSPFSAI